jgi:hypothetical protein
LLPHGLLWGAALGLRQGYLGKGALRPSRLSERLGGRPATGLLFAGLLCGSLRGASAGWAAPAPLGLRQGYLGKVALGLGGLSERLGATQVGRQVVELLV